MSVATTLALLGTFALGPSAQADHDPVIPSKQQVEDAKQGVAEASRSVAGIQADLATASARLDSLAIQAQQAAEAYNGAIWRWQQAKRAATVAARLANRYTALAEKTRTGLIALVLSHYTAHNDLDAYASVINSGGTEGFLTELSYRMASEGALQASYDKSEAQSDLAKVYEDMARQALKEADDAKQAADDAKRTAEQAVTAQQQAIGQIAVQRQALISELARVQGVSLDVARQRQKGLEQRRQERIAEQGRLEELERQTQLERQRKQRARQERIAEQGRLRRERQQQRHQQEQREDDTTNNRPQPAPPPPPPPTPPPPPGGSGNAQAAIDFAYAQLGEPYVWGAAGPDSWDCSGLTMGAWNYAGASIPHYSVAQYYATTPISYSDLRPGDLIFWASDASNPDTIFHVGLYIGNGKMIQAPRTGEDVEVQDVWYWESPDFFTRV